MDGWMDEWMNGHHHYNHPQPSSSSNIAFTFALPFPPRCELLSHPPAPPLSGASFSHLPASQRRELSGASFSSPPAAMAVVDFQALVAQHLAQQGAGPAIHPERPRTSARADASDLLEGFVEFDTQLKVYQTKPIQLTTANLYEVLPQFEGAGLHVDKLRRLGSVTHKEAARLRLRFRKDAVFTKRLSEFSAALKMLGKGVL
jgi:hypothetical protein